MTACGESGTNVAVPSTPAPSPSPLPTRTPLAAPVVAGVLAPPPGTIYFGAYVDTSGLTNGATSLDVGTLEGQLGRTLALDSEYQGFLTTFGDHANLDDFNNGRVPIDSWGCGEPDSAIAAGTYDTELRVKADSVKAYAWPVFMRYFWDPNLPSTNLARQGCYSSKTDDPNGVFDPVQYVKAWHHIRSIFQGEGATNAVFVWSVNAAGSNPLAYYPAPADVDWVGIDGYSSSSASFATTFAPAYATLSALGKPIMIAETGAPGTAQAPFFSGAAATLKTQFPLVQAFVYYDGVFYGSSVAAQNQDWRVVPGAFPAFTSFALDPYMAGTYAL